MARKDRVKLLKLLGIQNINNKNIKKKKVLLNKFIISRIKYHKITSDEYLYYVYPYLKSFLKEDGYFMGKEDENDGGHHTNYWKEI